MIQILTYSGKKECFTENDIEVNSIHSPKALDEFNINVISLADEDMWENGENNKDSINSIDDWRSLSVMIMNSCKTKIVILLPQNALYYYNYIYGGYQKSCELKNMIKNIVEYMLPQLCVVCSNIHICYENTSTEIGDECIDASFYFNCEDGILLRADKSNKVTTIKRDNVILSTLNLRNDNQVIGFLKEINLLKQEQVAPEWMEGIKMFDDAQQFGIIEENNQVIKIAHDNISSAMEKIKKNNEYKSILYTNGDKLVRVVFVILEKMLGCDLSQFEDKKKEDFLFEKNGCVFIGEIKGVNHNVKNENISQLETHYQGYLDENEDIDESFVKAILIMNHQKNKSLEAREPIHERQINLAKRNGSLIVETLTLLKLFEKYLEKRISQDECIELLKSNVGLLEI